MRRALLIAFLLFGLAVQSAAAAGTPSMGLRPVGKWKRGYFVYDAKPGQVVHGAIVVSNGGTAAGAVRVYPVDATTGQTSGAVYLTSGARPRNVGSWLTLDSPAATLKVGQSRTIPFTLRVPARATAGQHVGGIVAETVKQRVSGRSKGKANVQVRLRSLSIVAVQVNVPGPLRASVAVGGVYAGGRKGLQQLFLRLANTGNVMVKPHVTLRVTRSGKTLGVYSAKLDTVLPRTAIDYPLNVKGRGLGAGDYDSSVRVTFAGIGGGGAGVVAARPSFTISSGQQSQVFGGTTNQTQAPPGVAAPASGGSSGGTSPLVYAGAAVGILALLAVVFVLGTRRGRSAA